MPHSVLALHSHRRLFLIVALFDLSPDFMYFGVFIFFSPKFAKKKKKKSFVKFFFFPFLLVIMCIF